jgi:hypothetical protein
MTQQPLILLHEESMRMTHPVFRAAPKGVQVIYVWDDAYLKSTNYSLKRLIFIYETLCEMEVNIFRGNTCSILQEMNPSIVYIPSTNNPLLLEMIKSVREAFTIGMVDDEPFVFLNNSMVYKRFFQYWSKAKNRAFTHDGGMNA